MLRSHFSIVEDIRYLDALIVDARAAGEDTTRLDADMQGLVGELEELEDARSDTPGGWS